MTETIAILSLCYNGITEIGNGDYIAIKDNCYGIINENNEEINEFQRVPIRKVGPFVVLDESYAKTILKKTGTRYEPAGRVHNIQEVERAAIVHIAPYEKCLVGAAEQILLPPIYSQIKVLGQNMHGIRLWAVEHGGNSYEVIYNPLSDSVNHCGITVDAENCISFVATEFEGEHAFFKVLKQCVISSRKFVQRYKIQGVENETTYHRIAVEPGYEHYKIVSVWNKVGPETYKGLIDYSGNTIINVECGFNDVILTPVKGVYIVKRGARYGIYRENSNIQEHFIYDGYTVYNGITYLYYITDGTTVYHILGEDGYKHLTMNNAFYIYKLREEKEVYCLRLYGHVVYMDSKQNLLKRTDYTGTWDLVGQPTFKNDI